MIIPLKVKKASEDEEDIALAKAMKEADFSDTVLEEIIMTKLKTE